MIQAYKAKFSVPVTDFKSEPTADGLGVHSKISGKSVWEVEVEIDLAGIVREMGTRAVGNKGGVCRDGFVTVTRRRKLLSGELGK